MRSVFAGIILALTTSACGTYVTSAPLNDGPPLSRAGRPARSVAIYASAPPDRPYREVSILTVEQYHEPNAGGMDLMLERLRGQAAELGCDAVVLGNVSERNGDRWGNRLLPLDPGSTKMNATCIAFRRPHAAKTVATDDDGPAVRPAPRQHLDAEDPDDPPRHPH